MPNWNEILNEINATGSAHDVVRRRYLSQLHEFTSRNVIIYYAGWLQKPNLAGVQINDADKNGFMSVIHQLDRTLGLKIVELEQDHALQESVLSLHHSCIHTLGSTSAFKLIENQNGIAFIQTAQNVVVQ